jgi:hypothetical protein
VVELSNSEPFDFRLNMGTVKDPFRSPEWFHGIVSPSQMLQQMPEMHIGIGRSRVPKQGCAIGFDHGFQWPPSLSISRSASAFFAKAEVPAAFSDARF